MRISIILVIFLILFNGWAGLLQTYDIDNHLGISAETGDPEELDQAVNNSRDIQRGNAIGGTLLGLWNAVTNSFKSILVATNPGLQMLVNVVPPGPAEDLVVWGYSIVPIIIGIDIISILRGMNL